MGLEMEYSSQRHEFSVAKPSKTSSIFYQMVSEFAGVCELRLIGVFGSGNQNPDKVENVAELHESCGNDKKAHTQEFDVQRRRNSCDHVEICKVFDTLSVLKLSYINLQKAHLPYDPDKIRAANDCVVAQFKSLCRIKKAYKVKNLKDLNSTSACSALLAAETKDQKRLLEKLKSEMIAKEVEVLTLQQQLENLELQCKRLAGKSCELDKVSIELSNNCSFEQVVRNVEKAIHDFAKPLIALMKVSGWDLDRAVNSIESSVVYAKRCHKKYAFEAYIARRMFHGFSFQSQNKQSIINLDDPMNALIEDPQSSFAIFCRMKYMLVVHQKMEASFFDNLDHRIFVANGLHPQTPFYKAFVKMARWVWILQATCPAKMFTVKRGSKFVDMYMDCIYELREKTFKSITEEGGLKVEIMILPGFQIGRNLIKSRVYLSNAPLLGADCHATIS